MIDWSQQEKRPPLDVCRVRKSGEPHTSWPSWYANDIEHAMHFVRSNWESYPDEYPMDRSYAVLDHRSGKELGRFTVQEAVDADNA